MKIKLIFSLSFILLILIVSGCQDSREETIQQNYCETGFDCACGVHIETNQCFYGNYNYVNTSRQCPDFCTGITGHLRIKCIDNKCQQVSE